MTMMTNDMGKQTKTSKADVIREFGPLAEGGVHGVTFDGELVWYARNDELIGFDAESGQIQKRFAVPKANAGTAFDGENLYQLAGAEIIVLRRSDGRVVRKLKAPGGGEKDSGMAWADGYLWIGQWREKKINKVDPKTGEILKTLSSDRWVTGVSYVDGALWHATDGGGGQPAEIRKVGPDGSVEETIVLPPDVYVSGLESAGNGRFFCGGGSSGKVRLVDRLAER